MFMSDRYVSIVFLAAASRDLHYLPLHEGRLNRSGPSQKAKPLGNGCMPRITDLDLVSLNNDRNLHLPPGVNEHFLQFLRVFIHIDEVCFLTVDRPGLECIGSGISAVNDDFVRHDISPSIR